jgi:hypothetical protein
MYLTQDESLLFCKPVNFSRMGMPRADDSAKSLAVCIANTQQCFAFGNGAWGVVTEAMSPLRNIL